MTDRLVPVFLVAVFILVLGGIGGLTNATSPGVPGAEAVDPAGGQSLTCEQLKQVKLQIQAQDLNPHKEQIALAVINDLIADCEENTNGLSVHGRVISGTQFTLGLSGTGNFVDVSGLFDPSTGNYTGNGTGTVAGFPNVTVVLQLHIEAGSSIAGVGPTLNVTGTYTMGAGGELPGGQPGIYDVTGVVELNTPTPAPSPTAAPSATPTTAPTPTATAAPGLDVPFGDVDCSGQVDPSSSGSGTAGIAGVNPIDSLKILRGDAGLSSNTGNCPDLAAIVNIQAAATSGARLGIQGDGLDLPWGDVDCGGTMNPIDSLKILRFDAGLGVSQDEVCFDIGSLVTVTLT